MKAAIVLAIVLALASGGPANAAASDDAMSAALAWLKLVDSCKYAQSGKQSSAVFQKSVTPEKWESMLILGRASLGKLVSRAEKSRKHTTSLHGAPDGEYYVIQFSTSFEKKEEARETVAMILESDGQWRVAGYFIQ
jgi:hypothetical protein